MAGHSFPPVSLLKGLRTVHLDFQFPAFSEGIDQNALKAKIQSIVTTGGVTFVDTGAHCDALLNAKIFVICPASLADGSPFVFAYSVRFSVLATVAGHPHSELFMVFDEGSFGSTEPKLLGQTLDKIIDQCSQVLAKRLKV